MILNNKAYDTLKWIAQYLLPGLATLYFTLSQLWGLPFTEQIVGSIVTIDVFLGAFLGLGNMQYQAVQREIEFNEQNSDRYTQLSSFEDDTLPVSTGDSRFVFEIPSKLYDTLKWIILIALPAMGALYFGLSQFWGFPYGKEVIGTIAAITAFFGLVLGISTSEYNSSGRTE